MPAFPIRCLRAFDRLYTRPSTLAAVLLLLDLQRRIARDQPLSAVERAVRRELDGSPNGETTQRWLDLARAHQAGERAPATWRQVAERHPALLRRLGLAPGPADFSDIDTSEAAATGGGHTGAAAPAEEGRPAAAAAGDTDHGAASPAVRRGRIDPAELSKLLEKLLKEQEEDEEEDEEVDGPSPELLAAWESKRGVRIAMDLLVCWKPALDQFGWDPGAVFSDYPNELEWVTHTRLNLARGQVLYCVGGSRKAYEVSDGSMILHPATNLPATVRHPSLGEHPVYGARDEEAYLVFLDKIYPLSVPYDDFLSAHISMSLAETDGARDWRLDTLLDLARLATTVAAMVVTGGSAGAVLTEARAVIEVAETLLGLLRSERVLGEFQLEIRRDQIEAAPAMKSRFTPKRYDGLPAEELRWGPNLTTALASDGAAPHLFRADTVERGRRVEFGSLGTAADALGLETDSETAVVTGCDALFSVVLRYELHAPALPPSS